MSGKRTLGQTFRLGVGGMWGRVFRLTSYTLWPRFLLCKVRIITIPLRVVMHGLGVRLTELICVKHLECRRLCSAWHMMEGVLWTRHWVFP